MTDLPAGVITVADLYRELAGMRQEVGKALERLAIVDQRNQTADRVTADVESRLRMLERFRWTLFGVSTTVGAAAGVVAAFVTARGR